MKAIFNYFKRKKEEKKRMTELYKKAESLKLDLPNIVNSWSSSVAREMEAQLFILKDLQKKIDEMEEKERRK